MEDIIGRNAKNIHRKLEDTPEDLSDAYLVLKYAPKIYKKLKTAPNDDIRAVMATSFNFALQVITRLNGVPVHDTIMSVYMFCKDESYAFISREFESAIETAVLLPDKFVLSIHSFFNNLASKLRKHPDNMRAFMQFATYFIKLRYIKNRNNINPNVIVAYSDLIVCMFEYLRSDKYDVSTYVCGQTLSGETVEFQNKYGYINLIQMVATESALKHIGDSKYKMDDNLFATVSAKYGLSEIKTYADFTEYLRRLRVQQTTSAAMCAYINEYTSDIFPRYDEWFNDAIASIKLMHFDVPSDELQILLSSSRRRTLPANGVRVEFDCETECFKSMLLKEMYVGDSIVLLFRISLGIGDDSKGSDFCGFYQPTDGFLFSPFIEVHDDDIRDIIEKLVMYFYAVAVLDDERFTDENFSNVFSHFIYSAKAKSYGMGGTPKDTYHKDTTEKATGIRTDSDKYEAVVRPLNGFTRKLPDGQVASEEAQAKAKKLGLSLHTNETYVSPHYKTVYVLRDEEEDTETKTNH